MYQLRSRVDVYNHIDSFGLFGWGKLNEKCYHIIEEADLDEDADSTNDPVIIAKLIAAKGITTEIQITELQWN